MEQLEMGHKRGPRPPPGSHLLFRATSERPSLPCSKRPPLLCVEAVGRWPSGSCTAQRVSPGTLQLVLGRLRGRVQTSIREVLRRSQEGH